MTAMYAVSVAPRLRQAQTRREGIMGMGDVSPHNGPIRRSRCRSVGYTWGTSPVPALRHSPADRSQTPGQLRHRDSGDLEPAERAGADGQVRLFLHRGRLEARTGSRLWAKMEHPVVLYRVGSLPGRQVARAR